MTDVNVVASILHIDRNRLFREGLRRILGDSSFSVAGEAATVQEGLEQLPVLNPRMVIVDPEPFDDEAFTQLLETAGKHEPKPLLVVLTEKIGIARLANALDGGVSGYLLKDMSPDALKQSLQLALVGETVFPTDLACLLINNRFIVSRNGASGDGRAGGLSPRETEILSCLVNGLSNKEIANQLDITEGTVKVHLKGILKKIRVHNRTQAAIWAVQNGVVADVASNAPSPIRV